jgi:hypothetical protein
VTPRRRCVGDRSAPLLLPAAAGALTTQELKSKQVALPGAVAQLLQTHGWATPPSQCTAAQHQRPQQAAGNTASAGLFAVPGLTITSFHLEQLQASKQVCVGSCASLHL